MWMQISLTISMAFIPDEQAASERLASWDAEPILFILIVSRDFLKVYTNSILEQCAN